MSPSFSLSCTSELRTQSCGDVAAVRNHRGKGPQGREACGPTGRATDKVRVGGGPQNREVSRPHHSAFNPFACRRRDRVNPNCCTCSGLEVARLVREPIQRHVRSWWKLTLAARMLRQQPYGGSPTNQSRCR